MTLQDFLGPDSKLLMTNDIDPFADIPGNTSRCAILDEKTTEIQPRIFELWLHNGSTNGGFPDCRGNYTISVGRTARTVHVMDHHLGLFTRLVRNEFGQYRPTRPDRKLSPEVMGHIADFCVRVLVEAKIP